MSATIFTLGVLIDFIVGDYTFHLKSQLADVTNNLPFLLIELVLHGVGYHHAGLDVHDRNAMEELFLKGDLPVLSKSALLAQNTSLVFFSPGGLL